MDGTFSVTPNSFCQVYTIHAFIGGRAVPCLYCLLPNETEETYTLLLQKVRSSNSNAHRKSIMIDFERAMINSIVKVFPYVEVKGCFFHLCQNTYKKIQEAGLSSLYNKDENFSLQMQLFV